MSRTGSLVFSLTIVLLGVALRAAPYLDRVARVWTVDRGASATVAGESETLEKSLSKTMMEGVPSQLSQRPIGLLVAGLTTEALLIASMLYVGVRSALIAATFDALAVRYRVVTIGLLTLLVVGFISGSEQTFPFLPWRMYAGVPSRNSQAYEFVGISHRGQAVRLDLHHRTERESSERDPSVTPRFSLGSAPRDFAGGGPALQLQAPRGSTASHRGLNRDAVLQRIPHICRASSTCALVDRDELNGTAGGDRLVDFFRRLTLRRISGTRWRPDAWVRASLDFRDLALQSCHRPLFSACRASSFNL